MADERTIAIGQVWAQVSAQINSLDPEDWNLWHWLQDLYYDEGQLFAITISAGRLYRWPVNVDGDAVTVGKPVAVVVEFSSVDDGTMRHRPSSYGLSSTVRRTQDGRWVGCSILCTATVNKLGILDSRQLFDSFVERFKGDGTEYVNVLHLGGARSQIGFLRHVWREEKLLVGIYEFFQDGPLAEAAARTLADDAEGFWGGSIEFKHFGEPQLVEVAEGVKLPVTHDGQLFGYSLARNQDCAAWYTGNVVMQRAMTKREREIALELLGDEELVDQLQERLGEANRALEGAVTRTVQDTGYGIRDTGYGIRDTGCGGGRCPLPYPVFRILYPEERSDMSVGILTVGNLGRGFALGTATPGKVELDLGAGLAFSGNQVTPAAKRCLFVRRAAVQALGVGVDLLFDSVAVMQGIAYDGNTRVVTVPAAPGSVWRLTLLVHLNLMSTNTATIALVNAANGLLYPNTQLILFAAPSTVQAAGSMALDVLCTSRPPRGRSRLALCLAVARCGLTSCAG